MTSQYFNRFLWLVSHLSTMNFDIHLNLNNSLSGGEGLFFKGFPFKYIKNRKTYVEQYPDSHNYYRFPLLSHNIFWNRSSHRSLSFVQYQQKWYIIFHIMLIRVLKKSSLGLKEMDLKHPWNVKTRWWVCEVARQEMFTTAMHETSNF